MPGTVATRFTGGAQPRTVTRPPPALPLQAPVQTGGGIESSASPAGGGSFFGAAVLAALTGLLVPAVTSTLRIFRRPRTPEPFDLLLERPG
jgi:hypothetical protein